MISYEIEKMYRKTDSGGVFSVQAFANKTSNGHTVTCSTMVTLDPDPAANSFIPFEDLTQDIVISWVEANADIERLNNILDEKLAIAINPPTLEGLPWEL